MEQRNIDKLIIYLVQGAWKHFSSSGAQGNDSSIHVYEILKHVNGNNLGFIKRVIILEFIVNWIHPF